MTEVERLEAELVTVRKAWAETIRQLRQQRDTARNELAAIRDMLQDPESKTDPRPLLDIVRELSLRTKPSRYAAVISQIWEIVDPTSCDERTLPEIIRELAEKAKRQTSQPSPPAPEPLQFRVTKLEHTMGRVCRTLGLID